MTDTTPTKMKLFEANAENTINRINVVAINILNLFIHKCPDLKPMFMS